MLKDKFNIKLVDGSSSFNMWDGIDVYLRPTRHDGMARMIIEAKNLNIPFIWSYETGKYIEPNIDEIEKRLLEITKV